jgi:hypothetical protein
MLLVVGGIIYGKWCRKLKKTQMVAAGAVHLMRYAIFSAPINTRWIESH